MDEQYTDEQIRDWYAGEALVGVLAASAHPDIDLTMRPNLEKKAAFCFDVADAMMEERKRRQELQSGNAS